MTGDDTAKQLITARFRKDLPTETWIGEISNNYPEQRFELLTGAPTADGALGLGEIVGNSPVAAGDAIRSHQEIIEYDELYADTERLLTRFKWVDTGFFDFLRIESVAPEFPVVVRNGVMEFDVTVTRAQFERIVTKFESSNDPYELVSVVNDRTSDGVLTDRQQECLAVALSEGYFSVPRDCTLETVADRIGVEKSTASKTIRRGTSRVIKWFLVGSVGNSAA